MTWRNSDPVDAYLSFVGDTYLAQVDAVGELLELAATYADDRAFDIEEASEGLSASQQNKLSAALRDFSDFLESSLQPNGSGDRSSFSVKVDDIDVSRALAEVISREVHRVQMPPRDLLLMRSMLSLAISDFELLMTKIIEFLLAKRPALLGGEATLTLADLESVGDIEAARALIIDRKVDDLMRQGLDSWASWFDRSGVKFKDMCDDWAEFGEIFARRNLIVHAGGRVSKQYRSVLEGLGYPSSDIPDVGEEVPLSVEYLERSSEHLLSFGFLLVGGAWLQIEKGSHVPETWLRSRTAQILKRGHHRAARTICRTILGKSRGRLRRNTELSLQILLWTARRELGEGVDVLKEVAEWDTSGIDLRYAHARSVLLGEDEQAVREIQELRRREQLSSVDLLVDPLYRQLLDRRQEDLIGGEVSIPKEVAQSAKHDDDTPASS